MAQYDDLYLRSSLSDQGNIPRQGPQDHSPDLIPWGMSPQPEPDIFFAANYGQDVGRALVVNGANYIYVRAKNLGSAAGSGIVNLYWSKPELILYSSIWEKNVIKTSTGADSFKWSDIASGQIAVTRDPFIWTPPASSTPYALIARIATNRHPNPIPTPTIDLSAWVANNGGSDWRNVAVVDADSPLFCTLFPYEQGSTPARVAIIAQCKNCFAEGQSYVGFSSGTPLADGSIVELVKTQIASDDFIAGTEVNIQAGWTTQFALSLWSKQPPKPGASISFSAYFVADQQPQSARQMRTLGTITSEDILSATGDSK